jgi:multidrug efflux system outer membrane protein
MRRAGLLAFTAASISCALGPNYTRPSTPMAATFRDQAQAEAASFADLPWWEVFQDPALKALIDEALQNSYDLQEAAARVDIARENARISTDQLLPAVGIQAGASYQRVFSGASIPGSPHTFQYPAYSLLGTLSWEIDLWGRLRRLRESAYAQFFAAEENRRGVIVSLIGSVAQDYFNLLALDLQIAATNRTVQSREETLRLFQERLRGAVGDALDTTSGEAQLADARASLAGLQRQVAQTENEISYLIGRLPGEIKRGPDLLRNPSRLEQPTGIPASLLERRPDVRQAEALLVSANAQVGAALAGIFPTLSFSASGGVQSSSIDTLFNGDATTFAVNGVLNFLAPILNGAQNVHNYRAQQAFYRQEVLAYRRTVLIAFVEVSNALVAIKTYREQRAELETEVRAQTQRVQLANVRFRNGVASYLDVVQAEQNLYSAELALAQTIGAQFSSMAQLYRALGGGWQPAPAPSSPAPHVENAAAPAKSSP